MNLVRQLSEREFQATVSSGARLLVDFYADWCAPCRAMAPIVETVARDHQGRLTVGKLNVDDESQIAIRHGVRSIPTLIFFAGGEEVDRLVGYPGPREVKSWAAALVKMTADGKEPSRAQRSA